MNEPMNKAQRLMVAAAVAPSLRRVPEEVKRRRVGRLRDGVVVGYTTLGEVQEALLRARQIELEVSDECRPKENLCRNCGKTFRVGPRGTVSILCPQGCNRRCNVDGCKRMATVSQAKAASRAQFSGKPYVLRCPQCAKRHKLLMSSLGVRTLRGMSPAFLEALTTSESDAVLIDRFDVPRYALRWMRKLARQIVRLGGKLESRSA